jgi:plasmid stabilization system protein ParE
MRYEFHPEALEEYEEAALWYGEREPALALRFIDAVEDARSLSMKMRQSASEFSVAPAAARA